MKSPANESEKRERKGKKNLNKVLGQNVASA
jgi:hypothetical protein